MLINILVDIESERKSDALDRKRVTAETISIGSDPSCHLRVKAPFAAPKHALIRQAGNGDFMLVDCNSERGTLLNGRPVTLAPLKEGDKIGVGPASFTVVGLAGTDKASESRKGSGSHARSTVYLDTVEAMSFTIERARKIVVKALSAETKEKKPAPGASPSTTLRAVEAAFDKLQEQREMAARGQAHLAALIDIFLIVNSGIDMPARMSVCVDLLIDMLEADCGCLILRESERGPYKIKVKRGMKEIAEDMYSPADLGGDETPSLHIVKQALKTLAPVYISDAPNDRRFASAKSVHAQQVLAAACIPLVIDGEAAGAIYIDYRNVKRFDPRRRDKKTEIAFLTAFSQQASLALQNVRLADKLKSDEVDRSNLRRFLPEQVADELLKKGVGRELGGRRMEATALYAEIANFSHLVREIAPNQLVPRLNECFSALVEVVFAFDGAVHNLTGESLLAAFSGSAGGAAQEERALAAAGRMQKVFRQFAQHWSKLEIPVFALRIGVHRGDIVVGNIGGRRRMEFVALGDAVNLTRGICALAGPNQTLADAASARLAPKKYEALPLGKKEIAGGAGAIEVFEILERD